MKKIQTQATLIILAISTLYLPGIAQTQEYPSGEKFTKKAAEGFNTTSKSKNGLAPVYPYLAEYIADKFHLEERKGIGIDIGGGTGDLSIALCKETKNFYWINTDINPNVTEHVYRAAMEKECSHRIGMVYADVHSLPFKDNYADFVMSRGSLQFWNNREKGFSEIYRVMKPGAYAMIGRGFSENMPIEVAKEIRANQGKGKGMPKYNVDDTAKELEDLMKKLGVKNYDILMPQKDQKRVSYGVWVVFSKNISKAK